MRTKTIVLSAVALAAGLASSAAQVNVYSVNVVGYVNTVVEGNGKFTLMANPLDDGKGNQVTNILNNLLPKQSQVLTWDGIGFVTLQKVGTPPAFPAGTDLSLPPGKGFFVRNGGIASGVPSITNTFVGSVVVNSGGSVTNTLPIGFSLHGSPIPYAGNLAIATQGGGDTNMNFGGALTKQSQILTWDKVGQGYVTAQKVGTPAVWGTTAAIGVAEGFFINNRNGPVTNVVETLSQQ